MYRNCHAIIRGQKQQSREQSPHGSSSNSTQRLNASVHWVERQSRFMDRNCSASAQDRNCECVVAIKNIACGRHVKSICATTERPTLDGHGPKLKLSIVAVRIVVPLTYGKSCKMCFASFCLFAAQQMVQVKFNCCFAIQRIYASKTFPVRSFVRSSSFTV